MQSVLIVDDEPDLREILSFDFENMGFSVFSAPNGQEALKILSQKKIDVIISDVRMPKSDGVALLAEVKKDSEFPGPVLILVTGFTDLSLENAYDQGVDGFLGKPYDRKNLLQMIKNLLVPTQERWRQNEFKAPLKPDVFTVFANFEKARDETYLLMGRGGMFLALNDHFPMAGKSIHFKVEFEDRPWSALEGSGIARWVRPQNDGSRRAGIGVEFVSLTASANDYVNEILKNHRTKAFIPKG